jgi:hypothetical protein
MNRIRKSRLTSLVVLLLIPVLLTACTPEELAYAFYSFWFPSWAVCIPPGYIACVTRHPGQLSDVIACAVGTFYVCGFLSGLLLVQFVLMFCEIFPDICFLVSDESGTEAIRLCEEHPEECVAVFEQMQLTAIEFCEEHPAECQEAFDTWLESLDEETGE